MLTAIGKKYLRDKFYIFILVLHLFFSGYLILYKTGIRLVVVLGLVLMPVFCIWLEKRHRSFKDAVCFTRYKNQQAVFIAEQKEFGLNFFMFFLPTLLFLLIISPTVAGSLTFIFPIFLTYLVCGEAFILLKWLLNNQLALCLIIIIAVWDIFIATEFFSTRVIILLNPLIDNSFQSFFFTLIKTAIMTIFYVYCKNICQRIISENENKYISPNIIRYYALCPVHNNDGRLFK